MKSEYIKKLLIIFVLLGIIPGVFSGLIIGLMILSLFYNFAVSILFSMIVFPFFLWSFWKRLRTGDWFVIIRNFIVIYLISSFLTAMFSLEQGAIAFSNFDWVVISICTGFSIFVFFFAFFLEEFYKSSRLYKEISHIFKGMKMVGLIPEFEEKDKKNA